MPYTVSKIQHHLKRLIDVLHLFEASLMSQTRNASYESSEAILIQLFELQELTQSFFFAIRETQKRLNSDETYSI